MTLRCYDCVFIQILVYSFLIFLSLLPLSRGRATSSVKDNQSCASVSATAQNVCLLPCWRQLLGGIVTSETLANLNPPKPMERCDPLGSVQTPRHSKRMT